MNEKAIRSVRVEQLDQLIANSTIEYLRVFDTSTIAAVKLPNGYTLIGHSACVDPAMYNEEIGRKIALENAKQQLWALEGYVLKNEITASELQKETTNPKFTDCPF